MASRKIISSVLQNFLGTYTSRYSEYEGYWLFGFLVRDLDEAAFDLLNQEPTVPNTPVAMAMSLAAGRFADQMRKAKLQVSQIADATLRIKKQTTAATGLVNGHSCAGFILKFSATALMNDNKRYEHSRDIFVAPHDERVEIRSARRVESLR